MPCAVTALHQLETLFEFSIEYLVTNLQVKVVLVYKPLIVFIVIHEIWKKNCSCFFQISWIASKNNINWNKVVLPKFFQFLSFFLQQGKSQSWMIWLLNIISVKELWCKCWALLFFTCAWLEHNFDLWKFNETFKCHRERFWWFINYGNQLFF